MFAFFTSLIDVLCNRLCLIEENDKPFGKRLPIEVQNRIMWMVKHAEHLDQVKKLHWELKSRGICELTDLVRVPKTYERFHDPAKRDCLCLRCDPQPLCYWCTLYGTNNSSLEFMVMEWKLQQERGEWGATHDSVKYRQFEQRNLQKFRDVLVFTATQVLLPMLVYMRPSNYQYDYKLVRPPYSSFAAISIGHCMLIDEIIKETGATKFENPRKVKVSTQARARSWFAHMQEQSNKRGQ